MRGNSRLLAAVVVTTLVVGCGKNTEDTGTGSGTAPLPTAATLGEQIALSAQEYLAVAPYKDANRSRGERQAQICKACHSLDREGPNMIGPALYGFFGTQVGVRSGFEYSAQCQLRVDARSTKRLAGTAGSFPAREPHDIRRRAAAGRQG